ncbi:hypothetical protein [Cohnella caldifontis]|uniref:hypothetical protein n=1 Tax=Cohnella caldifontis TaxID=3027471 RepID=UPI0023EC1FED|nr:hypothetical protein [Cohnella sp. YIM B05605]
MKARKILAVIALLTIGFGSGAAFGAANMEKVEAFLRRDYQVFVDGKKADVGPVLVYNNSSYLPIAKVGSILGADVRWNEANKGIYVNPIVTKDSTVPVNPNYSSITMLQPQGFKASYRGIEVPVLSVVTSDYKTTYYRVSDIQKLQINTSGLHLALETRTKELYVSDSELAKAMTEKPVFSYVYDKLIIGETNQDKLDVIQDFIDLLPEMYKALGYKDPLNPQMDYYTVPNVFVIDALPNDEYNVLALENWNFKRYWLKLKKNVLDKWYLAENKITDLGSNQPQY